MRPPSVAPKGNNAKDEDTRGRSLVAVDHARELFPEHNRERDLQMCMPPEVYCTEAYCESQCPVPVFVDGP